MCVLFVLGLSVLPAVAQPADDSSRVAWLELTGTLREGPVPFAWVTEAEAGPSLSGVVEALDDVAASEKHLGVVLYLNAPRLGLSQIEVLGQAIDRVKAAGKRVIAFSESYETGTYLLAGYADTVVLQRNGMFMLRGLLVEEMYLAGLMEKLGLEADFMQVGRFKGADEALTREHPTPFWDENIGALLDDLYAQIVGRIGEHREMSVEQVEAVMRDSWLLSDEQLLRRGVVDAVTDRGMTALFEEAFGGDFVWEDLADRGRMQTPNNPFALFQMLFRPPAPRADGPSIAVIHARGPIYMGESTVGDGAFTDDSIGHRTMIDALRDSASDEDIKGVVVRIDSPGGSALASEVIWQAVRETAETKPVYMSVGRMAASGGYYIACAGDEIFVEGPSVVGSIGVVSGKIHLEGLYEKLDLGVTVRTRGPMSDMFASDRPFTPAQRHTMLAFMERIYDQFVDRIREGRGDRLPRVDEVAEGRLFTGRQAVANGMADEIGGLEEAVASLAEALDLEEGAYEVIDLPEPMSFQDFMQDAFGVRSAGMGVSLGMIAKPVLGDRWEVLRPVVEGALQLRREPALVLMPVVLDIRVSP